MLQYRIDSISSLKENDRRQLLNLMNQHYDGVDPRDFYRDLQEKTGIILLLAGSGEIQGFSTYLVYRSSAIDQRVIFSGDTVIHRNHWGSPLLFYGFGELMQALINSNEPGEKVYWFLLSKGIRTYGLLPLFFRDFYPSCNGSSQEWKELVDQLAMERFGGQYEKGRGSIPFKKDRLKDRLAEIPTHKAKDPHVDFFLRRNPLYIEGHELACITLIADSNVWPRAKRFLKGNDALRRGSFTPPL